MSFVVLQVALTVMTEFWGTQKLFGRGALTL